MQAGARAPRATAVETQALRVAKEETGVRVEVAEVREPVRAEARVRMEVAEARGLRSMVVAPEEMRPVEPPVATLVALSTAR